MPKMTAVEEQRIIVENRIINRCSSRMVKNSIMKDIDLLCELVRKEAHEDKP